MTKKVLSLKTKSVFSKVSLDMGIVGLQPNIQKSWYAL